MQSLKEEKMINIETIPKVSQVELRSFIAEKLAEENLWIVNRREKPVVPKSTIYTRYIKRIIDVVLSGVVLIILLPVNSVLAICTYLDVGTPIFFMQERLGKDERPFKIVKFRNMTNDRDEKGELLPPYKRVTKFGRFVRKTSLDELLNFWSIFKGDMSIIGPRPLPTGYLPRFSNRHRARHLVRPGLECPVIRPEGFRSSWDTQLENDIYYVENVSFALDVKMCLLLFKMVFDSKSSEIRGSGEIGTFLGYSKDGIAIDSHLVPIRYVQMYEKNKKEMLKIEETDDGEI